MKKLIAIIVVLALTGCASAFGPSRSDRIAYVESQGMSRYANPHIWKLSMQDAETAEEFEKYRVKYERDLIADAIVDGKIVEGMTKEQVRASWGDPCSYCGGSTHNSYGDTWEYNIFGTGSMGAGDGTYVYFNSNDRVTGWSSP